MGGLNLSFTGEETLRLYAQLRGIHPSRVETEVDNWIRLLGNWTIIASIFKYNINHLL